MPIINEDPISTRPWGKYQKFFQEPGVWVKRVEVGSRSRLSLQKHNHRSEKWIIVAGEGSALVDGKEIPVLPGVVVDVPLGVTHRMSNAKDQPLVFIEVATGDYLGEDDIVRLQDDYNR